MGDKVASPWGVVYRHRPRQPDNREVGQEVNPDSPVACRRWWH